MQASQIPSKISLPWGSSAVSPYIRTIPLLSQIGIQNGAASFTDGFPPWCFGPGGFPFGADFNGVLNQETAWSQWQAAGAPIYFDASFATSVGGYPQYALIASNSVPGAWWQSQVDNNTSNPDLGGANWVLCTMEQPYLDARYLRLPPSQNFYISASVGSDTLYDGTSPTVVGGTSHGPWATPAHAQSVLSSTYAFTGTISLFCDAGSLPGFTIGASSIGSWNVVGAGGPSNPYTTGTTTISATSGTVNTGRALVVSSSTVTVQKITFTSLLEGLVSDSTSLVRCFNCAVIGTGTTVGFASYYGSVLFLYNSVANTTNSCTLNISGSFAQHFYALQGGSIVIGFSDGISTSNMAITFGTTSVSGAVATATTNGVISFQVGHVTFAGTPTGLRYACSFGGGVSASAGGLSYIPGTIAGVAAGSTTITTALGIQAGWYAD